MGVVGGEVADPTRRRDTGEDGTSQDPEDVVEGTATSRRLGDMTGPERLRRIDGSADGGRFDGTYETCAERRGFGSRPPPSRSPSRVLEGSEGNTRGPHGDLSSGSEGGHAPKAPTASRVV